MSEPTPPTLAFHLTLPEMTHVILEAVREAIGPTVAAAVAGFDLRRCGDAWNTAQGKAYVAAEQALVEILNARVPTLDTPEARAHAIGFLQRHPALLTFAPDPCREESRENAREATTLATLFVVVLYESLYERTLEALGVRHVR